MIIEECSLKYIYIYVDQKTMRVQPKHLFLEL